MTSLKIEKLTLRPIIKDDAINIQKFFQTGTGRELNVDNLVTRIVQYPSLVAFQNDIVVGFIVSERFAPDILEIYDIYIERSLRSSGLGSYCLKEFERLTVQTSFEGIIAVNSKRYENPNDEKRPATNFYLNNGYGLVGKTSSTNIFYKRLQN